MAISCIFDYDMMLLMLLTRKIQCILTCLNSSFALLVKVLFFTQGCSVSHSKSHHKNFGISWSSSKQICKDRPCLDSMQLFAFLLWLDLPWLAFYIAWSNLWAVLPTSSFSSAVIWIDQHLAVLVFISNACLTMT